MIFEKIKPSAASSDEQSVSASHETHEHFMRLALDEARAAAARGEVPVGALVVREGVIIGRGSNSPLAQNDPTAHAEVLALRDAAAKLGNYRLDGCTLYVTLEPCTMCSGAMLHARVGQVVYGASEPKTGAAGSVLNVFAYEQINHQTTVVRGVLEQECAQLMADFFKQRRQENKVRDKALEPHPLKDMALRNPDSAFQHLPDWPWQPQWRSDLPALQGLRMAVVDEGAASSAQAEATQTTWLCLHGSPGWGYMFCHHLPALLNAGHRVIVPDLPGFGRSDQPKKDRDLSAARYIELLQQLVLAMDLRNVVLVGQGEGALLGLAAAQAIAERFSGAWLMDAWPLPSQQQPEARQQWFEQAARKPSWNVGQALAGAGPEAAAWNAPFAQAGHRAALKAWPAVQSVLPPLPQDLLMQWAAQKRLWLQPFMPGLVTQKWMKASDWQDAWKDAWQQAVPGLEASAPHWRLTQSGNLVPSLGQDEAADAVEYFAP